MPFPIRRLDMALLALEAAAAYLSRFLPIRPHMAGPGKTCGLSVLQVFQARPNVGGVLKTCLTGQPCPNKRLTDAVEMARGSTMKLRNYTTSVAPPLLRSAA